MIEGPSNLLRRLNPFLRSTARAALCTRFLLTLAALGLAYVFLPALYNSSTLLASAVLLLLVYRKDSASADRLRLHDLPPLSWKRVLLFGGLHAVILFLAHFRAAQIAAASLSYSFVASLTASAKLIVLFPTLVLFPPSAWRRIWRRYRAELLAAVVVLFTFFPNRLFMLAFPLSLGLLGSLVYQTAHLFIPEVKYVAGAAPTIIGPRLDVTIVFACTGVEGVYLFDYLFGFFALLEWNYLNKLRALASYAMGLATILTANILRIILLVLIGNLISPRWVRRFHIDAGWIFFSFVFICFLWITYGWMLRPPQSQTLTPVEAAGRRGAGRTARWPVSLILGL